MQVLIDSNDACVRVLHDGPGISALSRDRAPITLSAPPRRSNRAKIQIDAQPRGGNRQTAKGFCILYSFRFVEEHFKSVYQLRMRVYLCINLGVQKDQL
jgi:hypothetical protein